jgi:quinol monooxygenase YgiN
VVHRERPEFDDGEGAGAVLIVTGNIHVDPTERDAFVAESLPAVIAARKAPGCFDFVVAADPVEPGRVNVYERWRSEEALLAFRDKGPSAEMNAVIRHADVQRYEIASSGPA